MKKIIDPGYIWVKEEMGKILTKLKFKNKLIDFISIKSIISINYFNKRSVKRSRLYE